MTIQLFGSKALRYDALDFNIPLASSNSALVMLGVGAQN